MKRLVSGIAVVVMVLSGASLAGTVVASAAATSVPSISISPSTGLTNNEQVTITGTGFAPSEANLVALECNATATTAAGCNTSALDPITVSATGTFTSTFYVTTGTIGNGSCGTTAADAACLISVGNSSTGTVVTYSLISFATGPGVVVSPATNLANGASVAITGSGFTPGLSVYAVECLATSTTEAGCDTGTATPIAVSSTGTLPSTSFKVVAGTIGNGTCGTSTTNYDGCVIEVATITGTDRGVASIDFVAPNVTVAPPVATKVDGYAVVGRTVDITILGRNFTAGPRIIGHAGTVVTVLGHSAGKIAIKVRVVAGAKAGNYRFIIQFASGKRTSVAYSVI
jgi:hypothetical protein